MKKKMIYAALVIVCISFFSFREVGQCNTETSSLKKCLSHEIMPAMVDGEANFSPLYNLLKI
jgi:hypothetical protein